MAKTIRDILPKIAQWQSIPYSAGLNCRCGKCDLAYVAWDKDNRYVKADIVGWCETDYGLMAVFECPVCHQKFRCHTSTGNKWDEDDFEQGLYNFCMASTNNGPELVEKLEKENQE